MAADEISTLRVTDKGEKRGPKPQNAEPALKHMAVLVRGGSEQTVAARSAIRQGLYRVSQSEFSTMKHLCRLFRRHRTRLMRHKDGEASPAPYRTPTLKEAAWAEALARSGALWRFDTIPWAVWNQIAEKAREIEREILLSSEMRRIEEALRPYRELRRIEEALRPYRELRRIEELNAYAQGNRFRN